MFYKLLKKLSRSSQSIEQPVIIPEPEIPPSATPVNLTSNNIDSNNNINNNTDFNSKPKHSKRHKPITEKKSVSFHESINDNKVMDRMYPNSNQYYNQYTYPYPYPYQNYNQYSNQYSNQYYNQYSNQYNHSFYGNIKEPHAHLVQPQKKDVKIQETLYSKYNGISPEEEAILLFKLLNKQSRTIGTQTDFL